MRILTSILRWAFAVAASVGVTLGLFLVLPYMQSITAKEQDTLTTSQAPQILDEPPPDVKDEPPPPDEPEQEPPQPEIVDQPQVADVSLLDLPIGTGTGVTVPGPDTTINIDSALGGGGGLENMFDLDDLDKKATVLSQVSPKLNDTLRRKLKQAPATVIVVFEVDARGRVQKATVASSSDPAFNQAALNAVKQWTFEPAQRRGKPVSDRVRVPITFPKE